MKPTGTVRKTPITMARITVMTDTQEQDTSAISHLTPEELSEQDMQAVNGGAKYGNAEKMLEETLRYPSRRSSSSSLGIGRMHEGYPTPAPATGDKKGWSQASKAEAAAIGTGSATSFGVGLAAGAIENKL